jgi:predicted MFS family arabinose efflux permease
MIATLTDRRVIAWAIVVLALLVALWIWRRSRRHRHGSDSHLRIDLLGDDQERE